MDDVFKAPADPVRRTILEELSRRDGQTLFEICVLLMSVHQLTISRQGASKHLALLEAAGLVEIVPDGRYRRHHLRADHLTDTVTQWLAPFLREDLP